MRRGIVAILCLGLTACASGRTQAAGTRAQPGSTAIASHRPAGAPGPSDRPSRREGAGRPAPASSSTAHAGTARLDKACVRRAAPDDLQGLSIHIDGKEMVGYSTQYSDGSNELSNRTYTTGFGYGAIGPTGDFRATWAVPATAPLGRATVFVIATAPVAPTELPFTIVERTGACP